MTNRILLEISRKRGGVTYYFHVSRDKVVTGEHGDNPHGLNNESTCSAKAFLANHPDEGSRCRDIVRSNFGAKTVEAIVEALANASNES